MLFSHSLTQCLVRSLPLFNIGSGDKSKRERERKAKKALVLQKGKKRQRHAGRKEGQLSLAIAVKRFYTMMKISAANSLIRHSIAVSTNTHWITLRRKLNWLQYLDRFIQGRVLSIGLNDPPTHPSILTVRVSLSPPSYACTYV